MNRERFIAALAAQPLRGVYLVQNTTLGEGEGEDASLCRCGIGAMLHAAGVPDDQMRAFDTEHASNGEDTDEYIEKLDIAWGDTLAAHYGYPADVSLSVLDAVMYAVDNKQVETADAVWAELERQQLVTP
jgi:hypothetical protein